MRAIICMDSCYHHSLLNPQYQLQRTLFAPERRDENIENQREKVESHQETENGTITMITPKIIDVRVDIKDHMETKQEVGMTITTTMAE